MLRCKARGLVLLHLGDSETLELWLAFLRAREVEVRVCDTWSRFLIELAQHRPLYGVVLAPCIQSVIKRIRYAETLGIPLLCASSGLPPQQISDPDSGNKASSLGLSLIAAGFRFLPQRALGDDSGRDEDQRVSSIWDW